MDDHLNISSALAFSEQQDALIAAQQQVTQRVMDNNHMLREALKKEMSIADNFKRLYEAELAKNQKLEAQVAKLESRPISIKAEKYFEHYDVAHQVVTLQPRPTAKRLKSKTKYVDTANQLDLWKDNPAISL